MTALTDLQQVRLKTSDQARSYREQFTGDGVTQDLQLQHRQVASQTSVTIWLNASPLALTLDFTVDLANALIHIVVPPATNAKVVIDYSAVAFNDDEVQAFLDQSAGNVTLASALLLLAWSADASKLARRETDAGGGFGSVTLDTSVRSKELRESAKAYVVQYQTFEGLSVPADGLTEIAWTEGQREELFTIRLLRNLLNLNP